MAIQDHGLILKEIRKKMKNQPTLYKLYSFFRGASDTMHLDQVIEFKNIVIKRHSEFIKDLDKKIEQMTKEHSANNSKKATKS